MYLVIYNFFILLIKFSHQLFYRVPCVLVSGSSQNFWFQNTYKKSEKRQLQIQSFSRNSTIKRPLMPPPLTRQVKRIQSVKVFPLPLHKLNKVKHSKASPLEQNFKIANMVTQNFHLVPFEKHTPNHQTYPNKGIGKTVPKGSPLIQEYMLSQQMTKIRCVTPSHMEYKPIIWIPSPPQGKGESKVSILTTVF